MCLCTYGSTSHEHSDFHRRRESMVQVEILPVHSVRVTDLIIWDEAPMQHKFTFQAVDRTFRDLTGIDKPFGGKIMVMGGDFRQVLPVIPRANKLKLWMLH